MAELDRKQILTALRAVAAPGGGDPVRRGMVGGIAILADAAVQVALKVDPKDGPALEEMRQQAEAAIAALDGVARAQVILTAERVARRTEPAKAKAQAPAPEPPAEPAADRSAPTLPHVRQIVAIGSGKGGVGKSTLAFNLAVAMAQAGKRVALFDADIYGPSIPTLSGLSGKPEVTKEKRILPMPAHGIGVMSIGFLLDEARPVVWRGPMVTSAVQQMLRDVEWGTADAPLDLLIIDLPPGTGEVQITLSQAVALTGAVIVSTPQDVALADARKGLAMFQRVAVPILGMVENMAGFIAPDTGTAYPIFGEGGALREAQRRNVPFLGAVPLTMPLREASDAGRTVMADAPDDPAAVAIRAVADQLSLQLEQLQHAGRQPPRIVIMD